MAEALKPSRALQVTVSMRAELMALWDRSHASKEQLLRQLQDWCRRALRIWEGLITEFPDQPRNNFV